MQKRGLRIAERLDRKKVMTFEEALRVEQIVNQALIDILVTKGIISYEELLARIREIKKEQGIVL